MKTREFEKILQQSGFELVRSNGHSVWSDGANRVAVPHSKNINRMIARKILKQINYAGSVPELNYG